jgi:hypothetical protein
MVVAVLLFVVGPVITYPTKTNSTAGFLEEVKLLFNSSMKPACSDLGEYYPKL